MTRVDIGCGAPAERYQNCFGIDANPGCRPDLVWDCDHGLPFADDSLELVNSGNSLEHFRHPLFVLQECHRCLRPGGTLRVVVPNLHYLPTLLLAFFCDVDRYFYWYMRLPHKRERTVHQTLFTKSLLRRMVIDAGFRVAEEWGWLYSKEVGLTAISEPAGEQP